MRCQRCLNEDLNFFYLGSKGYYCRKCIRFKRLLVEEEIDASNYAIAADAYAVTWSFSLTDAQRRVIEVLKCHLASGKNIFLRAVCGAGKTEMIVPLLSLFIEGGKRVGLAIPRREVVIQLERRLKQLFPKAKICAVYGGHSEELYGDLIICTCHQLYRYYQYFDLLVLDEVDAYPFKGDEVLFNIAHNACRGQFVYSSATIDENLKRYLRKYELVELNSRPHGKPLIEPQYLPLSFIFSIFHFLYSFKRRGRQALFFVPSKAMCLSLYRFLSLFIKCAYCFSEADLRDENIRKFSNQDLDLLVCTTVLERGVTFLDIDVYLYHNGLFDKANLIQMSGRVGRNFHNPEGVVYFYGKYDVALRKAIAEVKLSNALSLLP